MLATNLKIVALAAVVLGFYTTIAHIIPQLESEVPEAIDISGGVTPEALVAAGEKLYNGGGGCTACHGLGTRAPNLLTDHAGEGMIGVRCATRESGKDCKAYLYESMTEPAKYVVKGFEVLMPDMRRLFSPEQIWALVAYLESQGGQVTVTAADIKATGGGLASAAGGPAPAATGMPDAAGAAGVPASTPVAPARPATMDSQQQKLFAAGEEIFNGTVGVCTKCHGTGLLAPNLLTDHAGEGPIGARCGGRAPGRDCKAYLYESLTDPKAYLVKGFDPIMPEVRGKLSNEQIWSLITFLEAQGGKVDVTAADIKRGAPIVAAAPSAPGATSGTVASASAGTAGTSGSAPTPAAGPPSGPPTPHPASLTPEALVATGENIFNGVGACGTCHNGLLAPNLLEDQEGLGPIGARCGGRVPGKDCNAYLYESITDPAAYLVKGFDTVPMPSMAGRFQPDQVWSLVAFLESQGGKVAVTAADVERTGAAAGGAAPASAAAAPGPASPARSATMDPRQLFKENECLNCHAIDGSGPETAPSFDRIGSRLPADRIRQEILDSAHGATSGFGHRLSAAQLEALVQFLAARR